MGYETYYPSQLDGSNHSSVGLRSLARIPFIGFILRWFADIVRLPVIQRHHAYNIELAERERHIMQLELRSIEDFQNKLRERAESDRLTGIARQDKFLAQTGEDVVTLRASLVALQQQLTELEQSQKRLASEADTRLSSIDASFGSINARLASADTHFNSTGIRLESTDKRLASADIHFNSTGIRLESVDKRLASADIRFTTIETRLETIGESIQRLRMESTNVFSELQELVALSTAWSKATDLVSRTASIFTERYGIDYAHLPTHLMGLIESNSFKDDENSSPEQNVICQEPTLELVTPQDSQTQALNPPIVPVAPIRPHITSYVGDNRVLTSIPRDLLLLCSSNDLQLTPAILTTGVWEPSTTELFERLIPAGGSYLEIGANIGYFSALAATYVGHYGSIFAFEPHPEAFRLLHQNLRLNRLTYIATLRQSAVADTAGKRTMKSFASNLPSSTLSNLGPTILAEMGEDCIDIEVNCTTLDDEFANSDRKFDFVKIDAEGSEPLIVSGAKLFIERNLRPDAVVLLEWNPPAMRGIGADGAVMLATLFQNGFSVFRILSGHQVSTVRTVYDLDQWNLVDLLITRAVSTLHAKGLTIT